MDQKATAKGFQIHELKTWPAYFQPIVEGKKTFEYRQADRDFNVDDLLFLREWSPASEEYTGGSVLVTVTYIAPGDGQVIPKGYCIMAIRLTEMLASVCHDCREGE